MTAIDWAIVILVLLLLPVGYRQGMLVGVLALAGFAFGALLGSRLGPLVLNEGSASPYAPAVALIGGLLVGGVLAMALESVGTTIRPRLVRHPAVARLDAAGGAVVVGLLGLAIAWVVGAVALNTPALKPYRDDIQRSQILSALNQRFPPSGPLLNALNSVDLTPSLEGPSADVAAPKKGILAEPAVEEAGASVVRVSGTACGLIVTGSGWVAAPELVVTNAHVLAGHDSSTVETRDGAAFDGFAVVYRPRDDIAVLRVPGLTATPLELASDPQRGIPGAIAGYPGGGDLSVVPARLGTTGEVSSQDSYGRGPIDRRMTSFRGEVLSGNSGGAVIDATGRVLTTVFASTVGTDPPEGLGVPNEIATKVLTRAGEPVGTGPCA